MKPSRIIDIALTSSIVVIETISDTASRMMKTIRSAMVSCRAPI